MNINKLHISIILIFCISIFIFFSSCDDEEEIYHFNVTNSSGTECGFYISAESVSGRRISRVYRLANVESVDIYYYYNETDLSWPSDEEGELSNVVYTHTDTNVAIIRQNGPVSVYNSQDVTINAGSIVVVH